MVKTLPIGFIDLSTEILNLKIEPLMKRKMSSILKRTVGQTLLGQILLRQILIGLITLLPFISSAAEDTSVITLTPEQMESYQFQTQPSNVKVKDLSVGQQAIMSSQRRAAKDLLYRNLGIVKITGTKDDLRHLQQIVDRKVLGKSQVAEWQSIGVLFGDILAREFNLKWVSYEDELGANKALRYRQSQNFIFPVTLFSKRMKFDEEIDMRGVYATLEVEIKQFILAENRLKLPNT